MDTNLQLRIGTGGGTVLGILGSLGVGDVLATAVLAAVGAAVSFGVTLALQRWLGKKPK